MDMRRRTGALIQVKPGSKRTCQEKFSCEGSEVQFECRECGTRQCAVCEKKLHSSSAKFASHSRKKIEPASFADGVKLCGMWCYPYNPAEFSCLECKNLFCSECNRAFHRGKLSRHHRAHLPRPDPICESPIPNGEQTVSERTNDVESYESIVSRSPELDPFLDALPPPLSLLPPSHPSLDGICTEIKQFKQHLEESDEDFMSLESQYDPLKPCQIENLDAELLKGDEFCSLEPSKIDSLKFLSGHFEETLVGKTHLRDHFKEQVDFGVTDSIENICNTPPPMEESHGVHISGKLRTVVDPVMDCNMSRGMHASMDSDIGQLIIPDQCSEIDRGIMNPSDSGVSPSSEESLQMLENMSMNQTPPSSLDSDPGRLKSRKEAVVQGMPRKHKGSHKKEDLRDLKNVRLRTVNNYKQGFLLVNEHEELQVNSSEELFGMLGCSGTSLVKVVSIFGNTGDGKSFTLNHTFFEGQEVFHTSDTQQSCTIGIWAAYHKESNVITIDTEGLLGTSSNENRRMRLLLKILAVSDVVIYRSRAERLGRDMFKFLGDASKAFVKHFAKELEAAMAKIGLKTGGLSSLGPAVIVFHETQHTKPLGEDETGAPADTLLHKQFEEMDSSMGAFRSLQYVGIQTVHPPTDFKKIKSAIFKHIQDTAVRSPRSPSVVFQALKVLNDKFSGNITASLPATFPDEYFTCPEKCMSCGSRCVHTMNHSEKQPHKAETLCKYQHQFDNKVFLCMACSEKDGMKREVVPKTCSSADSSWFGLVKYAWSGYVLECPKCGIIYRSREKWYGNEEPNVSAVKSEIRHIWPGDNIALQGTHNAARKLVDGISSVVDTISTVGAKLPRSCHNGCQTRLLLHTGDQTQR